VLGSPVAPSAYLIT